MIDVCATMLDQKLCGLQLPSTDGIVERCLTVFVTRIRVRGKTLDQSLAYLSVALPSCIEDWGLLVGVNMIDIAAPAHEEVHKTQISFSASVIEGSLAQLVLDGNINSILNEILYHSDAWVLLFYQSGIKDSIVVILVVVKVGENL